MDDSVRRRLIDNGESLSALACLEKEMAFVFTLTRRSRRQDRFPYRPLVYPRPTRPVWRDYRTRRFSLDGPFRKYPIDKLADYTIQAATCQFAYWVESRIQEYGDSND